MKIPENCKLCTREKVYERNRHIGRYISGGHDTQTYIYMNMYIEPIV